jgi:hypothetical protein
MVSNIVQITSYLEIVEKVIIRSCTVVHKCNAIVLGALVRYFKIDFYRAIELVRSKVPMYNILRSNIRALKKLLDVS